MLTWIITRSQKYIHLKWSALYTCTEDLYKTNCTITLQLSNGHGSIFSTAHFQHGGFLLHSSKANRSKSEQQNEYHTHVYMAHIFVIFN